MYGDSFATLRKQTKRCLRKHELYKNLFLEQFMGPQTHLLNYRRYLDVVGINASMKRH